MAAARTAAPFGVIPDSLRRFRRPGPYGGLDLGTGDFLQWAEPVGLRTIAVTAFYPIHPEVWLFNGPLVERHAHVFVPYADDEDHYQRECDAAIAQAELWTLELVASIETYGTWLLRKLEELGKESG
jgi:hypothetical protein